MPGDKRKTASQPDVDPFKDPSPGGSKRLAATQPNPVSASSDSDEPGVKTPKKARRSGVAAPRNKALWSHFQLDLTLPKEEHTKNTKVCDDPNLVLTCEVFLDLSF
jgi:hypothetical protein